nr:MAG TPA: hydrogenase/urease nickel incorporation protein [Caudoviricetes sp.]
MAIEYIDREKAKRLLHIEYAYAAEQLLDEIPAADVAPVVHGVWVRVHKIDPISGYRCSKCRRIVGFDLTPYCPNCGAKMDGGDSNEAD